MNNKESKFFNLFMKQKYCDVKFIFNSENETRLVIGAHKLILSVESNVFETMFYGEGVPLGAGRKMDEIHISDFEPRTFRTFLLFIYGANVEARDTQEMVELLRIARKYNCIYAITAFAKMIFSIVNIGNAVMLYETSQEFHFPQLAKASQKVFMLETDKVLKSPGFLAASPNTVRDIFRLENLNIDSEMDLVHAIETYIEHNETSESKIAVKVRGAIDFIRFLTLEATDVAKTSFLSAEEVRQIILCSIPGSDLKQMPLNFSQSKIKRGKNAQGNPKKMKISM